MPSRTARRGFTLVETVVTVGIIAALAAVVYPTVVKQFDTADPARIAEDLGNIRTGMEAFGVNVRPQLPGDVEDLINRPIVAAGTLDSTSIGSVYTSIEQAAWLGPYVALSALPTVGQTDTVAVTGFNARIINRLNTYDLTAAAFVGGDTVPPGDPTAEFVAVRIVGLSGAAFNAANQLIDGPMEADATTRRSSGRFRCPAAVYVDNAPCANAYFLAVPTR
jgi:prepilin-type N-terminal cleavage/methylation domain-containing protein